MSLRFFIIYPCGLLFIPTKFLFLSLRRMEFLSGQSHSASPHPSISMLNDVNVNEDAAILQRKNHQHWNTGLQGVARSESENRKIKNIGKLSVQERKIYTRLENANLSPTQIRNFSQRLQKQKRKQCKRFATCDFRKTEKRINPRSSRGLNTRHLQKLRNLKVLFFRRMQKYKHRRPTNNNKYKNQKYVNHAKQFSNELTKPPF